MLPFQVICVLGSAVCARAFKIRQVLRWRLEQACKHFFLLPTALAFSIQTILPGPNCVISGPPSAPILSSFGFCRPELDPFAAHAMRLVGWHQLAVVLRLQEELADSVEKRKNGG